MPSRGFAPRVTRRSGGHRIVSLLAVACLIVAEPVAAQTVPVKRPADGLIESGAPAFSVVGLHALGLAAAPRNIQRLADGRLVVVGRGELAIGDGARWEVLQQAEGDARVDTESVATDPDGAIYAGVPGGFARIAFGEDGRWRFEPVAGLPAELGPETPALIRVETLGDTWLWSWTSGPIVLWRPGIAARVVGSANAVERFFEIAGVVHYSDGSNGRLFRLTDAGFAPVDQPAGTFVEDTITSTGAFDDGVCLAGTIGRGLVRLDREGRATRLVQHGTLAGGHRINDLCVVADRFVAAAVDNVGVVFIEPSGRIVQVLDRAIDHRLARVQRMFASPGGVVWLRLNDAIARVRFPARVSAFEPLVPSALSFAQLFRRDGRLWIMSDGKAQRGVYDGDGRLARFEIDTPAGYVASLFQLGPDWLATTTEGIWRWRGLEDWECVVAGVNSAYVRPEQVAPGSWMYVAQDEVGWFERRGDGYVAERFPVDGLGHAYGAVADGDGIFWAELGVGRVARIEPGEGGPHVEVYGPDDGLGNAWAQLFLVDGMPRLNVPPHILRFNPTRRRWDVDTEILDRMPGLRGAVGRPVLDARGRLWVPAEDGVRLSAPGEVGALVSSISGELRPAHIMPQEDGVMWLHQPRRLVRYDPGLPEVVAPGLRAMITRVEYSGSGRTVFGPVARLPAARADDNALSVYFVAPDQPLGQAVTFSVTMEGAKRSDTVSTGTVGHVTFSRLDPGEYRLRVTPLAGGAAGTEAELAVAVLAPWYRTSLAYLTYGLGACGLLVFVGWAPAWMARREKVRLERLVVERTAELARANEELAQQVVREREEEARRRKLETELFQAQKLESIGTLAGGIAHDFNNLLTGILGCCELATVAAREGQPVQADLQEIRAASLRAKDLVGRILTFSRRSEPKLAPIDLADAVAEALRLIRATTPATIDIVSVLEPGIVRADATQMHQVVVNLCTNAVHAMGTAGRLDVVVESAAVEGELAARLPELAPGPHMRLMVADTGHGMDAATLARVFDPFFTTKAPGQGTGLGLSIVRGILDNHRAALRVHSEPRRGTRVEVFIPRATESASAPAPLPPVVLHGCQRQIMVVDDEPAVAKYIAARLHRLEFRTQVFHEPLAARAAFEKDPGAFSALVTDLTMPQISGIELLHALRAITPLLPVVVVSGFNREMAGLEQSKLSRVVVLTKPFSGEELTGALSQVLEPADSGAHGGT